MAPPLSTPDKQQIRVRIAFIDAPEKGQAFDQRAKAAVSELVLGKDVVLQPHTIDRYGRLVTRILIDDQEWNCSKKVFAGYAKNVNGHWIETSY